MNGGLQVPRERQEAHEKQVAQEVNLCLRDREEILRQIADVAFHPIGPTPVHPEQRIAQTTSRFAALLISLANTADAQFKENMKVQRTLIRLTRWVVGTAIVLIVLAAFTLFKMLFPGSP